MMKYDANVHLFFSWFATASLIHELKVLRRYGGIFLLCSIVLFHCTICVMVCNAYARVLSNHSLSLSINQKNL